MKKTVISILLIIVLGFAAYANSLKGEFVWDDKQLVQENFYIKHWSNIDKIFTQNIAAGAERKSSFYRPIQMLTYMLDYSLWRLNVLGYHLTNTLLHILAALCLYWLVSILFKHNLLSLLTSLFFVLHPVHTEAVSYISGRADSLALLFMLSSFICYIKYLQQHKASLYFLCLISLILALLSRENSLILPALLLLYHFSFKQRLRWKLWLPLLGIIIVYVLVRFTFLRPLLLHTLCSTTFWQRIPGFLVALSNYVRLITMPFNLHMEYGDRLFGFFHPQALLGAAIFIALVVYAWRTRKANSFIFFSISWFLVTLIPVSNLYPIAIAFMAEHWLYMPSIGFFLILAKLLTNLYQVQKQKIIALVIIILLIVFYFSLTVQQNIHWQTPLALYEWTLRHAPDSPRNLTSLGLTYSQLGRKEEAINFYKKAISVTPTYTDAYNNLGLAYYDIGNIEQAIETFQKAIEINPEYTFPYYNLGFVYNKIGRKEEALERFTKAIELSPHYAEAYNNIGSTYKDLGRFEQAIAAYQKAIEIDPGYAQAYFNLANAYSAIGKLEKAVFSYKKAVELDADFVAAYNNLANIYSDTNQKEKAISLYKKATEIDPDFAEGYNNLGLAYYALERKDEAISAFKKTIEKNPQHANAHYSLAIAYYNKKQYKLAIEYCDKAKNLGVVNHEFLEALKPYRE